MGYHYYVTTINKVAVQTESILMQLIFDYSLRARVVSEGPEKDKDKKNDRSSFIGKLNNMVTSDMVSINQAKLFVIFCECRCFFRGSRFLLLIFVYHSLVSPSANYLLLCASLSYPWVEVVQFTPFGFSDTAC